MKVIGSLFAAFHSPIGTFVFLSGLAIPAIWTDVWYVALVLVPIGAALMSIDLLRPGVRGVKHAIEAAAVDNEVRQALDDARHSGPALLQAVRDTINFAQEDPVGSQEPVMAETELRRKLAIDGFTYIDWYASTHDGGARQRSHLRAGDPAIDSVLNWHCEPVFADEVVLHELKLRFATKFRDEVSKTSVDFICAGSLGAYLFGLKIGEALGIPVTPYPYIVSQASRRKVARQGRVIFFDATINSGTNYYHLRHGLSEIGYDVVSVWLIIKMDAQLSGRRSTRTIDEALCLYSSHELLDALTQEERATLPHTNSSDSPLHDEGVTA